MADPDQVLLRAIQRINDPDLEPERIEQDSDESSVEEELVTPLDPDMQRMQDDAALRQHLGIGGSFTGPKGVIADRKFHKQQERARYLDKQARDYQKVSDRSLQSGWLQRQLEQESTFTLSEEVDADAQFMAEYRRKRLLELSGQTSGPTFGSVQELNVDSYVDVVDGQQKDVVVVVHLYQQGVQACRLVNTFLDRLASSYRQVKFTKIIATEADKEFDLIALPALLVYQNGGDII